MVRDDFDPERSDVDVLVDFLPDRIPAWEFFHWGEELEPILGRKVDLVSKVGKYLWPSVKEDLTTIYKQVLP